MNFGCQDQSKHLRILMFNSSLSNILPRLMRRFTMWVNLFCTSEMVSPSSILNISYSWIKACFLALFTLVVPSWVTSKMSYISFADAHWETLENSSQFKAKVIIFLASNHIELSCFHCPFTPRFFNKNFIFFSLRNEMTICDSMPDSSINWFNKKFHFDLPKLIIQSIKQRWTVYGSTLPKW